MMMERGVAKVTVRAVVTDGFENFFGLLIAAVLHVSTALCAAFRASLLETRESNFL